MLSEKWFERLQDLVHKLLPHPPTDTRRVKIAILDSGVDLTHPTIVCNKQRIMAKRSFLMQDSPREQAKDMIGHGTHILGLLLKVAPYADIYVARITKSHEFDEFQSIADVWPAAPLE
jgi:subtilisin family serine protease